METVRESSLHFISPGQLQLFENALGNPDLIQAVTGSNCTVTIVDAQHFPLTELEQWPVFRLSAADIKLNAGAGAYYIYIVVPAPENTDVTAATVGYSTHRLTLTGHNPQGQLVGRQGFFYYPAGTVSAQQPQPDGNGSPTRSITLDLGCVPPQVNLPGDLNDYDKVFQIDKVDPANPNSWLLTILTKVKSMVAHKVNITGQLIFGSGSSERPVTGVAVQEQVGSPDAVSDSILATTAWAQAQFSALDDRFLRKDQPDSTAYLLKLLGGAEVGEAIDSFIAGKGTILDKHGRIQTDRLEVRNSMKVLELIINRLQGMENDFVFSPTRKINKVEKVDATTYKLFLEPKMDGDLIPFREGNILYSIVNDLLTGGSNYYTSYMRVLTTNQNEYSITVSLYPDSEVPGGKNYLPAEGYNVSRRGDVHLPQDGQSNPDAQSWYLSSSEGRLLFLQNVVKPVLEDYNYALSIGKFPRVQAVEDIGLPEDAVGVMAETIVAQHIYQYDYNGDVVANKVNRGAWAREVAESDKPYRRVTMESVRPTGTKYTLLEQHTVYHLGCLWGCLVDKTKEEPKWNAQGWQLLEGNSELTLNLQLDGTEAFRIGEVDVDILAQVLFGHNDITEDVKAQKGFVTEWFRDTGNAPADNLWKPAYVGNDKLRIHIDNGNEHGVGSDFGFGCKKVVFTCRVYVPVDGGMRQMEQSLGFNLV